MLIGPARFHRHLFFQVLVPIANVETIDSKLVAEFLIASMHRFKDPAVKEIGNRYRYVLFDALSPMTEIARQRLMKAIIRCSHSKCPADVEIKLIGFKKQTEEYSLLNQSHHLLKLLYEEMAKKGTHLRDPKRWLKLQQTELTEETLKQLEFPFNLCKELYGVYPNAHDFSCTNLIERIWKNRRNISSDQTKIIFAEIARANDRGKFLKIIVEVLNNFSDRMEHPSMNAIFRTIPIANILNNVTENYMFLHVPKIGAQIFFVISELSEDVQQSILRALKNYHQSTKKMLLMVFQWNGVEKEYRETDGQHLLVHKDRLKLVCFNFNCFKDQNKGRDPFCNRRNNGRDPFCNRRSKRKKTNEA